MQLPQLQKNGPVLKRDAITVDAFFFTYVITRYHSNRGVSAVSRCAADLEIGFLFPHADFVQALAKLGYDINDGITNLMPIVVYCEDE